jgi:preprotein translocase subunit YajC
MSLSPLAPFFSHVFAQVSNAAAGAAGTAVPGDTAAPQSAPSWTPFLYIILFVAMIYFALLRPQMQAKKQQEEKIKSAKTGDKVVTSSGIHGLITNVKDTTVIVKVADNVKLEIEKSHIDKITRPDNDSEKAVTAKVS